MIGYLAVELHEPLGYVGGALVVDRYGLPLEFRHTLPVRPTKLQRALYGDALDRYLRTVVVARRLLDALEVRPSLVLVADPGLVLDDGEPPTAHLTVSGMDPVGPTGHVAPLDGASDGFLLQARAGEAPLRLVTAAQPHLHGELARVVLDAAETTDVREPLARVRAGLLLIAQGEVAAA